MAAGLAMAFAGVGCSDDEPAPGSGSPNWNIDGNEIVNIQPERATLLRNPMYTNEVVEDVVPGYQSGGYVAIIAHK